MASWAPFSTSRLCYRFSHSPTTDSISQHRNPHLFQQDSSRQTFNSFPLTRLRVLKVQAVSLMAWSALLGGGMRRAIALAPGVIWETLTIIFPSVPRGLTLPSLDIFKFLRSSKKKNSFFCIKLMVSGNQIQKRPLTLGGRTRNLLPVRVDGSG